MTEKVTKAKEKLSSVHAKIKEEGLEQHLPSRCMSGMKATLAKGDELLALFEVTTSEGEAVFKELQTKHSEFHEECTRRIQSANVQYKDARADHEVV